MSERCSGCGLLDPNGTAGCRALFEEVLVRDYSDFRYARVHRKIVDTYCLQHPERYCASAKSFAAHLTGLCWAFEHNGHPPVGRALLRWLDANPSIDRPEPPSPRGEITIVEVYAAPDAEAHALAVESWARSTWEAYAAPHPLARRWLAEAFAQR